MDSTDSNVAPQGPMEHAPDPPGFDDQVMLPVSQRNLDIILTAAKIEVARADQAKCNAEAVRKLAQDMAGQRARRSNGQGPPPGHPAAEPGPHFNEGKGQSPEAPAHPDAMPIADFLQEETQPLDWLVDDVILAGGLSMISAKPKVGKSVLATALLSSVGLGLNFIGRQTRKAACLYLSIDQARAITQVRFRTMFEHSTELPDLYVETSVSENVQDRLNWLRDQVTRLNLSLVVIDTLAVFLPHLFGSGKMSDGGYTSGLDSMNELRKISADTGAHVCVVHHDKKGESEYGEGILGSTSLLGAIDTHINLGRDVNGRHISIMHRHGGDLDKTYYALDEYGHPVIAGNAADLKAEKLSSEIVEFLANHPESTTEDIKRGVTGSDGMVLNALKQLIRIDKVTQTGTGRKGDPYKSSLKNG